MSLNPYAKPFVPYHLRTSVHLGTPVIAELRLEVVSSQPEPEPESESPPDAPRPLPATGRQTRVSKKRKRVCWSEEIVSKEGEALKHTERIKVPKQDIFVSWKEFVDEDTKFNTYDNEKKFMNKSEDFYSDTYIDKSGNKITHPGFVSAFKIKSLRKENYHKASDPTAALASILVSSRNKQLEGFPEAVLKDCVEYLEFKISVIEETGKTMFDYSSGLAAYTQHLPLLNRCKEEIKRYLENKI